MTEFFYPGHGERFKRTVHQAGLGLAVSIGCFSAIAFALRRERHLAVNMVIAFGVAALERHNARCHR